jgi:hypothetical protein
MYTPLTPPEILTCCPDARLTSKKFNNSVEYTITGCGITVAGYDYKKTVKQFCYKVAIEKEKRKHKRIR